MSEDSHDADKDARSCGQGDHLRVMQSGSKLMQIGSTRV